jgi:hypothetical protein
MQFKARTKSQWMVRLSQNKLGKKMEVLSYFVFPMRNTIDF